MKRLKTFARKSLIVGSALLVSGVVSTGSVFAQGELTAELVALTAGSSISGVPGQTITVPVNVYLTEQGTNDTSAVTVTVNFAGNAAKTVSFQANEFNVSKKVELEYTIPLTADTSTITPLVHMKSSNPTGNEGVMNNKADYVTIHVTPLPAATTIAPAPVLAPADTTAPVITITDSGKIFNFNAVPLSFEDFVTVSDDLDANPTIEYKTGDSPVTSFPSTEGLHTVSVTAIDAAGNRSSNSFSYVIDNSAPEVTLSNDGLIFNSSRSIKSFGDFVSVQDNLDANPVVEYKNGENVITDLPVSEGFHTINVSAADHADNQTAKSFSYTVDNTDPEVDLTGLPAVVPYQGSAQYDLSELVSDTNLEITRVNGVESDSLSLDTNSSGKKQVTITGEDKAGNVTEKTYEYEVVGSFTGVLSPINLNGTSVFKKGSTVPVKFKFTDSTGETIKLDSNPTIKIQKESASVFSAINEESNSNLSSAGNLFRFDAAEELYIYNFGTKNQTFGLYNVQITVSINGVIATYTSQNFGLK